MRLRAASTTLLPLLPALFLAACGGDSTGPRISTVEVSPASATLQEAGATQQFSARLLGPGGQPVTGEPVTWSSDDLAVATVSAAGLATAVATGIATISATAGGVTGTALLTVLEPDRECVDPETVTLAVGQHAAFGSQECFVLPAGSAGDWYRVVVMRPDSGAASSVVDASLSVTGLGAAARSPATAPVTAAPAGDGISARLTDGAAEALERSLRLSASTERFHARLRASEEALVGRLRPEAVLSSRPARVPALQAAPQKVRIDPSTTCDDPDGESTGILVYQSPELAVYQDSAQQTTSPVTPGQARRMADYYTRYGKRVIEDYFGSPTDVDGNGRMIVFVSPAVSDDQVAAFVWSGDFLDQADCPASNEGEVIFFSANIIQALDQDPANYQALETLVHEVKHVVSLYNRIRASLAVGAGRFQPLWVEEGTAEIAGNMSSRVAMEAVSGVPVGSRLTVQDLTNSEDRLEQTPENYGVLLRLLRTVRYLSSQPNGVIVDPVGALEDHSVYGTGWNFHRWLGDAYGNAALARADSALFRQLADSVTAPGTAGLLAVTGRTFKQLFEEFALAVALHETGAPEGLRGFTSYDFVSATDILCRPGSGNGCPAGVDPQPDGLYPWPVTERSGEPGTTVPAPFASAVYRGPIGPTGLRIHDFLSDGLGGVQIDLSMAAPGKMLVVRLR